MIAWQSRNNLAVLFGRQHTAKSVGKVGSARVISPVPTDARADKRKFCASRYPVKTNVLFIFTGCSQEIDNSQATLMASTLQGWESSASLADVGEPPSPHGCAGVREPVVFSVKPVRLRPPYVHWSPTARPVPGLPHAHHPR